jgi:hypothetical protein
MVKSLWKAGMTDIKLEDNERQRCEVWTRAMGYYRPVDFFNIGKKQEFKDRTPYQELSSFSPVETIEDDSCQPEERETIEFPVLSSFGHIEVTR